MNKPKVFFTGEDRLGWALDEDIKLTCRALEGMIELTDLDNCEVIHSAYWSALLSLPRNKLLGKRIICHVPGEPRRYLGLPQHRHALKMIGRLIVRSHEAANQFTAIGIPNMYIPYTICTKTFHPLPSNHPTLIEFRRKRNIPDNCYLIASFQRDTQGYDLREPKLVKGPDIFLEIVSLLRKRGLPIHVVLAGPRRNWLRNQLALRGIPFTFIGQSSEVDDIKINSIPREMLNLLYNIIDLYVVSSRSEGGPQSVMEAAASRCKIISTRVALAKDILDPSCLYTNPMEALTIIEQDFREGQLSETLEIQLECIKKHHNPVAAKPFFCKLYKNLQIIPPFKGEPSIQRKSLYRVPGMKRLSHLILHYFRRNTKLRVGLWYSPLMSPHSNDRQFMFMLRKSLQKRGIEVFEDECDPNLDVLLLNYTQFDTEGIIPQNRRHKCRIIHRFDGTSLRIEDFDREKNDLCLKLNEQLVCATVLQSAWFYERLVEIGYCPVNPVIIYDTVDPDLFTQNGRIPFDSERKIRLITICGSDNPDTDATIYKWIENNLDWQHFEYTLVGNISEKFNRFRQLPPIPSEQLAELLRQNDIYIAPSRKDPCSLSLIEALSCGLPALYFNDGGHPELVGYGGLPFKKKEEILGELEKLVNNYETFQHLITVPSMDEVANNYLSLFREAADLPLPAPIKVNSQPQRSIFH